MLKKIYSFIILAIVFGVYIIYKQGLPFEIQLEKVQKVNVPDHVLNQMTGTEMLNRLESFKANSAVMRSISSEKDRATFTANYLLDEQGKVTQIELITTSNSLDVIEKLKLQKLEFEDYVNNVLLKEYIEESRKTKIVKPIVLNGRIVDKMSNKEIQQYLGIFFDENEVIAGLSSEDLESGMEVKLIVDEVSGKIWQIELVSYLPKEDAETLLTPIQRAMQEFTDSVMMAKVNNIEEL